MERSRTALVTGGSRGIGHAIAARFRDGGYRVLVPARDEMDLASAASIAAYVARVADDRVDVLVNNAAENEPTELADVRAEAIDRILDVNVRAPLLLTTTLGVAMAARGWGRIVNLSSVYAFVSRPKRAMYTTTKAAINGLTIASAVELAPGNVLVNAICPGFVDTDLTRRNNTPEELERLCASVPLRRLAEPGEIARLAYFLGSHENTYVTGQTIVIDGGFTCR